MAGLLQSSLPAALETSQRQIVLRAPAAPVRRLSVLASQLKASQKSAGKAQSASPSVARSDTRIVSTSAVAAPEKADLGYKLGPSSLVGHLDRADPPGAGKSLPD